MLMEPLSYIAYFFLFSIILLSLLEKKEWISRKSKDIDLDKFLET